MVLEVYILARMHLFTTVGSCLNLFYCSYSDLVLLNFLMDDRMISYQVGCGAGNTIFPLLATYPNLFAHACDFSPRAVDLVKVRSFTFALKRMAP